MDKKHCQGCYDNFYNSREGGCWSLESAKLVSKWRIHRDTPMDSRKGFTRVKVPSCYSDGCTPKKFYYFERLPEHLGGDDA